VNLAGNPALAIPIPMNDKAVSVTSLQLIGPRLSEAELLNAGRLIETSVLAKSAHKLARMSSVRMLPAHFPAASIDVGS
jgi:Asp-tRNA(Asn)/Glu-tRNA(Gln) amidotransferase A subunit family amidase